MNEIAFVVHGKPATAGSKTVFSYQRDGQTHVGIRPANQRQKPFMAAVAATAAETADGIFWQTEPLWLKVVIYRSRPASHFRTGKNSHLLRGGAPSMPTGKPDSLKVVRAIEDALAGVLYRDDSQICRHTIYKWWSLLGEDRVLIVITDNLEITEPYDDHANL